MHILAAFDKCKDSLTAREICSIAKNTVRKLNSTISVDTIPISDGGEGFADLLTEYKSGIFHHFSVLDSIAREKNAAIGIIESGNIDSSIFEFVNLPKNKRIAVVEMSSVVGLSDLKNSERNPWKTSTYGVGQLLAKVSELDVGGIILGIGGSSTNDIGIGALKGLGMELLNNCGEDILFPSPNTWSDIKDISINNLLNLPPIRIACDVNNPLLGFNGATYQFGSQKGLLSEDKERMEQGVTDISDKLSATFDKSLSLRENSGAGAAGGIGYGLNLFYDVEFIPGFSLVKKWFDLESKIKNSDLILTGEGRFDKTSLYGKGPYEIIQLASKFNKPTFLLAGSVDSEVLSHFDSSYSNLKIDSFGNEELKLEENLARASEFFEKKLIEVLAFVK